jgi:hypothetical protein
MTRALRDVVRRRSGELPDTASMLQRRMYRMKLNSDQQCPLANLRKPQPLPSTNRVHGEIDSENHTSDGVPSNLCMLRRP